VLVGEAKVGFLVEAGCGGGDGEWQDDGALEREIVRNGADEGFGNDGVELVTAVFWLLRP
jgi:hypothetical protein